MDSFALLPLARWRLANWHRAFWRVFFSAALAVVFIILVLRSTAEDPYKNHIESRKALMALKSPPIPDEENAAVDYRKAFVAMVPVLNFKGTRVDPTSNISSEGAYFASAEVAAYMKANSASYSNIDDATDKELCDWELDYGAGMEMKVDHYTPMRQSARMLCARARVKAHAGDIAGAADDLKRVNQLARHIGDGNLFNGLIQQSLLAIADNTLQAIVIHDPPTRAEDIAALRAAMQIPLDPYGDFARTYEIESVFGAEVLDRIATTDVAQNNLPVSFGVPKEVAFVIRMIYGSERKTQRALSAEILRTAREGKIILDDEAFIRRNQKGPSPFTALDMHAFSRVQITFARNADMRRCIDAGLAVMQFRAKYGRDPKSLLNLVPEFMPDGPSDFFTKQPLMLRKDESETVFHFRAGGQTVETKSPLGTIRIYSLGQNGKDDGGHGETSPEHPPSGLVKGDDSVFFIPPKK